MIDWKRSEELIIGGNGLISKRPGRYAPNYWPTYYEKASGSKIKANNGKWYLDFSEFSIGCNLFGYAPNHLRFLPLKYIFSSPLSTLNSIYEPLLAEELNKCLSKDLSWKFTRGGGESMALAVRYARALCYEKHSPILVTGYHGWHDWYLATNISSNSLDELLIPGLIPKGVPNELENTVIGCKIEDLKTNIKRLKPSIIVYEGSRSNLMGEEEIKELNLFQREGGVLIADEITSGFRTKELLFSKRYGINPDFVTLGKSLGSGYAISAVGCSCRRNEISQLTNIFASSTFWTEEIGLKAGYLTLKYFQKENKKIFKQLEEKTSLIRDAMIKACKLNDFKLEINLHPTLIYTSIFFKDYKMDNIKPLLCSLFLDEGILFSNNIYPSISHSINDISKFKKSSIKVFYRAKQILLSKSKEEIIEEYGVLNDGFQRLTN